MQYGQGRWYEIGRYDHRNREQGADCVLFDYTTEGDQMYCVFKEIIKKKLVTTKWTVKLASDAAGSAKIIYSYVKDRTFFYYIVLFIIFMPQADGLYHNS